MKILILLGAPGSGKGTQAEILSENIGYKKLSTGDMLRDIANGNSDISKEVKLLMDRGELISDEIITKVVQNCLNKNIDKGVILDGYPRTINQASSLIDYLGDGVINIKVIDINIDDSLLIERITGRFSCKNCKAGYHEIYKKLKVVGICDKCGSKEFLRRDDDNVVTVKNRLKNYYEDTVPVANFFKNLGLYNMVEGDNDIKMVYNDINKIISQTNHNK